MFIVYTAIYHSYLLVFLSPSLSLPDSDPQHVIASIITDSGHSESSESAITLTPDALLLQQHHQQQQHLQQQQQQQQPQNNQQHLPSSYPPSSVATLVPGVSLTNAQQTYGGIGGTGGSGGGGGGNMGVGGGVSGGVGIIGSNNCGTTASISGLTTSGATVPGLEMGHSRNSSNTSQVRIIYIMQMNIINKQKQL